MSITSTFTADTTRRKGFKFFWALLALSALDEVIPPDGARDPYRRRHDGAVADVGQRGGVGVGQLKPE